ncbi:MAG TPA: hypothetical protein VFI23_03375 [Rhizomicrobium sp.]|nr:hypothetical protein [Rhizomicrobium sp.]
MVHPKKVDKDNQYKLALGALIMSASHLEMLILDLMSLAMGADIVSTIIVAGHQQASSKIDCLIALVRANAGDANKDIQDTENGPVKVLLRARELLDFRNSVVHAFWIENEDGGLSSTRFSARQRFTRSRKPQKPATMTAYADEMDTISDRLEAWRDDWAKSEEPSPLGDREPK